MNVSASSAVSSAQYAQASLATAPAKGPQPIDGDGDHDGTKAAPGRVDVKL